MAHAMQHRGPDDEGTYVSPDSRVGFANRRLAIRDLSPAGHMPMSNTSGSVCITYNGEVYNTDDLRPELERLGYVFRSNSDTEVILHGYEAWGSDIVRRLEGMFAFAIYDIRETPRLLFARDQMGIKPLYYAYASEGFVFASELKALFASGLVNKEISPAGLVGYLLMGSVPNPLTIYSAVAALEPAAFIEFDLGRWEHPQPVTYWKLPTDTLEETTVADAAARIEELLADAVRIRLVSDVPLGAFLSGGLDSSAMVAFMRRATSGPIRTCSMVFEEAEYSEAAYARETAAFVGAEHYERVITAADVEREFDRILYAMDQPSIDGVNTYFVSQTAREAGLTVALSGLGGDELFGGYPNTFHDVPRIYQALQLVHGLPFGPAIAQRAIKVVSNRPGWKRMEDALRQPPSLASAYLTRRGLFSTAEAQALVHPDLWQAACAQFDAVQHVAMKADGHLNAQNERFGWVSRAELRTYTHHQLLRDTDVMSMIHSLEVRVPFFDTRLIEAALRLPAQVKAFDRDVPKPLLNKILQGKVPASITARRDKQGFTFPFAVWLRGALRSRVEQLLQETAAAGLMRQEAVASIAQDFQAGRVHWSRLWGLAALAWTKV